MSLERKTEAKSSDLTDGQDLIKNKTSSGFHFTRSLGLSKGENSECSLKIREWMTTDEAARYLGVSVGSLRNMTSNGSVPFYKLGRRNRYNVVELRQLLLSKKIGGCHGN